MSVFEEMLDLNKEYLWCFDHYDVEKMKEMSQTMAKMYKVWARKLGISWVKVENLCMMMRTDLRVNGGI